MAELERVKEGLGGWREVGIQVFSVVTWEQDWHPALTAGTVTTLYLAVYYFSPSLLTLVSLLGLLATLLDYSVPLLTSKLAPAWTAEKEARLEKLARFLLGVSACISTMVTTCRQYKLSAPLYHFAGSCLLLAGTAYLGTILSGMFLAYSTTMLIVMLPGLHKRGLLAKYCSSLVNMVEEKVKGKKLK